MKILFMSHDLLGANLAWLMSEESHDVRLWVEDVGRRENFRGMLEQVTDWGKALEWVGRDGLIVFDDVGFGKIQDRLRTDGYLVFGGSAAADKLEIDRQFAQKVFAEAGMQVVPHHRFDELADAIAFVRKHQNRWVIKQGSEAQKSVNLVGELDDGSDVLGVLESYAKHKNSKAYSPIYLQEYVEGIEVGVARYFNGSDWVGPLEINIEHKKFLVDDLGPSTGEMGTVAWYEPDESHKLYRQSLAKLEPYLRKIQFKGDIDINCIVNERGAFPLEVTPRLGSPIIQLHSELHLSPWGELLRAIAAGESYDLKYHPGIGVVLMLAAPPFPYYGQVPDVSIKGAVLPLDRLSAAELSHIHFEEISRRPKPGSGYEYYVSDDRGMVLYITAAADSLGEAREQVYELAKKVHMPKALYRTDIGARFAKERQTLRDWGYHVPHP